MVVWYIMTIKLPVTTRDRLEKINHLRANGRVPGVVYGPKQPSLAISIDGKLLDKVLKEAGESTIIEITGLTEPIDVLVKDVSFGTVKQQIEHVDLYAVERGKKMTTSVHIEYGGESPAEKEGLGVVNKVLHEVMVTCIPAKLPGHLEVSLDTLAKVGDRILSKEIVLPEAVELASDPNEVVAIVSELTEEEPEESVEVDMNAVAVEKKGKGEETVG